MLTPIPHRGSIKRSVAPQRPAIAHDHRMRRDGLTVDRLSQLQVEDDMAVSIAVSEVRRDRYEDVCEGEPGDEVV